MVDTASVHQDSGCPETGSTSQRQPDLLHTAETLATVQLLSGLPLGKHDPSKRPSVLCRARDSSWPEKNKTSPSLDRHLSPAERLVTPTSLSFRLQRGENDHAIHHNIHA